MKAEVEKETSDQFKKRPAKEKGTYLTAKIDPDGNKVKMNNVSVKQVERRDRRSE